MAERWFMTRWARLRRVLRRLSLRLWPKPTQEYAIAMYAGETPLTLRPIRNARQPVLTRHHVNDVPAAFVADPFMLRHEGIWYMWFEVMRADTGLGEIGVATSVDGITWTYGGIVLAEPFHLSFPYVFTWKGVTYMLPETGSAGSVRLYRATSLPTGWTLDTVLMPDAPLLDASVFKHDGRWWMLAEAGTAAVRGTKQPRYGTLRLFFANDPQGPWTEHPMSPVIEGDPSRARPAGRVVAVDGRPLRFAQDCSVVYGQAVRAFEIEELSETTYRERLLSPAPILGPGVQRWNRHGMHHVDPHLTSDGWVACVDGWRWQRHYAWQRSPCARRKR